MGPLEFELDGIGWGLGQNGSRGLEALGGVDIVIPFYLPTNLPTYLLSFKTFDATSSIVCSRSLAIIIFTNQD
jgi:hypothetical protein